MATDLQQRRRLRFDGFEVDLRAGELRKHGARIRLQGQPLQVLVLLLESAGEVVTREELKQQLWPADTFVDFDDGLNTAVKKLRDALDDSADRPRYIETLPRRGYRFIGALNPNQDAGCDIPEPALRPKETTWAGWPGWRPAVAAVILLAALAVVGTKVYSIRSQPQVHQRASVRSIAVLPLSNLSGDAGQDYFAAGLTDELTTELARIDSLRVISHTSAVLYEGKPLAQIAGELQVDAVLEGSVVRSGNRVRVNAQLIQARTDQHLWAESYDRDLRDVLALQSEIASTIAHQVQLTLSPQLQERLVSRPRVIPEAYDLYLRATAHLGQMNRADNRQSIDLLEKAVASDPNFALAYAELAIEYSVRAAEFRPGQRELQEQAKMAAAKALALDPNLPEGYMARARLTWVRANHFPHEAAIADLQHALRLDPNLGEAHHLLGNIYNHVGVLDKAGAHIQQAMAVDPTSPARRFRVGVNLLYQGRWQEALQVLRDSQQFFPALWAYQNAFALVQLGRLDDAEQLVRNSAREDTPETAGLLESMEAVLAARRGNSDRAESKIRASIRRGEQFQHFHHVAYGIASAYAVMNRRREALHWLRRAAEDGFPCYPLFLKDHNLDNLRQDPQFVKFMADLEQQWKHYAA